MHCFRAKSSYQLINFLPNALFSREIQLSVNLNSLGIPSFGTKSSYQLIEFPTQFVIIRIFARNPINS